MIFTPPRLHFSGCAPERMPPLLRVMQDCVSHFPKELLERPFVAGTAGRRRTVLVADPQAINEILLNRDGLFSRVRQHDRILASVYGEHLLRDDVVDWRQQRRAAAQPMSTERCQLLVPRMQLGIQRLMGEWDAHPAGEPLDIVRDSRRLTLDILWRAFFCSAENAELSEPLVDAAALGIDSCPAGSSVEHVRFLQPLVDLVMQQQAAESSDHEPMEPIDSGMLLLFLNAGHDNVSATLSWTLWMLAHRPEWQQRVRDEWPDAQGVQRVEFGAHANTLAVVREALRLFPPILHLVREVGTDMEVAGETLPGGFTALLSFYALQRSRLWWEEPDQFRPERFLGEDADDLKRRLLWVPFGAGPRGCIGAIFAQIELVLALGNIVSRFELLPVPGETLECDAEWALRPRGRRALAIRPLR